MASHDVENYDVDFSFSKTDGPDDFDTHMAMYAVFGVPANLKGDERLAYIENLLLQEIPAIAKIQSLRIRGE